MKRSRILLTLGFLTPCAGASDFVAIRVGRAETVAHGTIEHAVILVEGSKIVAIGEDLPVERGIPIVERPDWVAMPGLVCAYSRLGMDSAGGSKSTPEIHASDELYPAAREYEDVLEYGVTTLGLYPPGSAVPGLAVAVKPSGATKQEMILKDEVYLKVILRRTKSSKKMLIDGFDKADKHEEKEQKAREKWDKDQEKKKSAKKGGAKKEEEKKEEKKEEEKKEEGKEEPKEEAKAEAKAEEGSDVYVPLVPDPQARVFLDLRAKKLPALVSVAGAAEYLHFLDALGDEKIDWSLRLPLAPESDLFYVLDKDEYGLAVDGIGEHGVRVVVEPRITRHPGTMRERNLPAELARAGAKLVLIPGEGEDGLGELRNWLVEAGEVVAKGLDRQTALRALTLEPAALLGLADRLGSLEKDKDANLVFLSGDPFEPATRIEAVMLEGEVVYGEVKP